MLVLNFGQISRLTILRIMRKYLTSHALPTKPKQKQRKTEKKKEN